jgi:signal transduction histidine kinase
MERALSRLLEREEGAPFALAIEPAERAEFPFLVGRFEIAAEAPAAQRGAWRSDLGDEPQARAEEVVVAPAEVRGAVAALRRDESQGREAGGKETRANETSQQPGSTLDLRAKKGAAAPRVEAEEKDAISAYDALRSLNKAVQERVARQRKADRDEQEGLAAADPAAAFAGARTLAPPQARSLDGESLGRLVGDDGAPLRGRVVDDRHVVLYRNALRDGRMVRQGVALDLSRLQEWLRAQALGEPNLAANARVEFATAAAPVRLGEGGGEFLYRHRFAEPFADLSAVLSLRPLPGLGSTTYVYALSVSLLITAVLGLAALYRMVAVVVANADRRSNFVAAVTHELKTPLTAIRMYGEMLRDGMVPSDGKRQEYYRHITAESERLSRLINNVLEFSRLEKGNRAVSWTRGEPGEVLHEIAALLRPHAAEQGFELELEIEPGLPPLRFDRDALVQVLFNLIDNAVKYARDAGDRRIVLSARRAGRSVLFVVGDRGPGVPAGQLEAIFAAFYRGENELTRRNKGTGLGLALVRGLVERMGGRVRARNRPGGGFEVEVELRAEE